MTICVYGAASEKIDASFKEKTYELGKYLAKECISVVFGAGACGLMGACARGVRSVDGTLVGIVPKFFTGDGIRFDDCTETIFTDTMRERKKLMEDMSDAFIVTPGGIGTFDEFFEIFTLQNLDQHRKPIAIFNINNYYNPMLEWLRQTVESKFVSETAFNRLIISDSPEEILSKIKSFVY